MRGSYHLLIKLLRFAVAKGTKANWSHRVKPELILGVLMSLFYGCRWYAGQVPASRVGLFISPPDFYLVSAGLSPVLWPLLAQITARTGQALNGFGFTPNRPLIDAYTIPLLIWLGIGEFSVWLLVPDRLFPMLALFLMALACASVYVQIFRQLGVYEPTLWRRHLKTLATLFPQVILAAPFFR